MLRRGPVHPVGDESRGCTWGLRGSGVEVGTLRGGVGSLGTTVGEGAGPGEVDGVERAGKAGGAAGKAAGLT